MNNYLSFLIYLLLLSTIIKGSFLIINGIIVAKNSIEFYIICKKIKKYESILNKAKKNKKKLKKN